jgi:hypothetical protein
VTAHHHPSKRGAAETPLCAPARSKMPLDFKNTTTRGRSTTPEAPNPPPPPASPPVLAAQGEEADDAARHAVPLPAPTAAAEPVSIFSLAPISPSNAVVGTSSAVLRTWTPRFFIASISDATVDSAMPRDASRRQKVLKPARMASLHVKDTQ